MSSNMAGGVPVSDPQADIGPQLALQNVYLKDCSYEAPNGPRVDGNWNPQINLDLHTTANGLTPELREVVLTVTVAAKQNDVTIFLVQNGVLPARPCIHSAALTSLAQSGVTILADDFSLRERGIAADALVQGVRAAALDVVIDGMADGAKTIWH